MLYESFSDRLSGIDPIQADPAIDGTAPEAEYYSPRLDDDILDSVRKVASIHLGGQRLVMDKTETSLDFLFRLRCVDSLSDYLILALQSITEDSPYTLERWEPREPGREDTGHVEDDDESAEHAELEVNLVHISDLMSHEKLNLAIPVTRFNLKKDSAVAAPSYWFVSHSWVGKGMPDTEDGKFYRAFLLMAVAIYLDTGVEYFWVDYLCVTQDPAAKALKARQIGQIPAIVRRAAGFVSMCLEIYQYFSSAWCALEALSFLGMNQNCRPFDFLNHIDRSTYRFGMNIVDPTKVNANEKIIFSFTDQPFTCAVAEEAEFLTAQIKQAKAYALARIFRLAARPIKVAADIGFVDHLGIFITGEVLDFVSQNLFGPDFKSSTVVLDEINSILLTIGQPSISAERREGLATHLDKCGALLRALGNIGVFWPGVRLRHGGAYDLDTSQLTTSYAFYNQITGRL